MRLKNKIKCKDLIYKSQKKYVSKVNYLYIDENNMRNKYHILRNIFFFLIKNTIGMFLF